MSLNILLVEPYYGGSHRAWADGIVQHSSHSFELLTLPDKFWKWRMQGGAVSLARLFRERGCSFDLIVASDMMDLSLFRAILRRDIENIPVALYFHENQLSYPQNRRQLHGWQYGFINYASALAADAIFFNSAYHMEAFFRELPRMLKHFADFNELESINTLVNRANVLPVGLNLRAFDKYYTGGSPKVSSPIILWNHRWDDDKNPSEFFDSIIALDREGYDFRLAITGENTRQQPMEFEHARKHFGERIIHFGYVEQFSTYAQILWEADYVVSTAYQDFFGIAVCEAIYCDCIPILADRLNYPYLIPQKCHQDCLFNRNSLKDLMAQHLQGLRSPDTASLKSAVEKYDWHFMIKAYDQAFEDLVH